MLHPLDGCRAKIDRANHNIRELSRLCTAFLSPDSYKFVTDIEDGGKEHVYRVIGPPDPPLEFAVRTGEILNHLRSALDHLIWALVLRRHKTADFRVQYPICLVPADYKSAVNNGIIKGVSKSAQTIIERTQPYHASVPKRDPLAILHDLNNIDKHKLLLVVASYTYVPHSISLDFTTTNHPRYDEIEYIPVDWPDRMVRSVEGGAELLRMRFERPISVKMNAQFAPQIALEDFGASQNEPLLIRLAILRDSVVKTIDLFRGEF
jgi:hypothetical protein